MITSEVPEDDPQPRRDAWRIEVDAPFDVETVSRISIGGPMVSDNYVNRGDVIVRFDGPPDRIVVEMRRFTFGRDENGFDRLSLWTHVLDETPPPAAARPPSACAERWDQDCGVRVYYDGQVQPSRSGADIRITLPPQFIGVLEVFTEDNDRHQEYRETAEVCVAGLRGSAAIQLGSGRAWVSLAEDIVPTPGCPEQDLLACEDAEPPWDSECPCAQQPGFGYVAVAGAAADVLVSVPLDLRSTFDVGVKAPCEGTLDGMPSASGYAVRAQNEACRMVEYFESPEDWLAQTEPRVELRGHIEVCRDCLRDVTCDALLDG